MDSSQTTASAATGGVPAGGNVMMTRQSNDASPVESSATTVGTAGTLMDDQKQNLTEVINSILKTLGVLHQLSLTVSSFNVASQLPLLQRMYLIGHLIFILANYVLFGFMPLFSSECFYCGLYRGLLGLEVLLVIEYVFHRNNLVLELDNMTRLADKCNIQVPMEILNLVDDGKNPDEFTRDMLNGCIAKNQITKGKAYAFKSMRRHLLEELEQAFPDEVDAYREIRAASAAVSYIVYMLFLVNVNFICL
ncbi:hypothetical protein DH2020_043719 [Rehmannia glutinosa]|uniref:Mediator of RNA polymerase II transcription subunit 10 n=1 Tax=Rehmannia glutinosa TaxID=99300 RepID=A0ABR0UJA7_REHGL